MRFLYNFVLGIGLLPFVPYLLWRIFTGKETADSALQKLGRYAAPRPAQGGIWVHAVSVGETKAAIPLVERLLRENRPVIFSASTQTGMAVAKGRLEGAADLVFFPFDFPFAAKKAVAHVAPSVAVMMETEIWPNFLHYCARAGCRTVMINGRISGRSFARYKKARWLIAPVLGGMDLLLMQSDADARRIIELGADPGRVRVTGNIKFDAPAPPPEEKTAVARRFGLPEYGTVVVFASVHPGEVEPLMHTARDLSAHRGGLSFVVAPRHIERAEKMAQACSSNGFTPVLRSSGQPVPEGSVLVLDTIGELSQLYGAADVAVIGGSFIPHGGQNPLEAAAWGVPALFGPHMENFREIAEKLVADGGAKQVAGAAELKSALETWLADPREKERAGRAAQETLLKNRGALEKTARAVLELANG